ncbi:unnamed protein product [Acanthoscelides obtectus]|uniref:Uncharacterized protein n=1 Tax=Acanthoscelides obtectus TaxID=200917 RepID=A0A9P0QE46_ACAOB|nr:unnamed protein product [Acanthoscelides obtectus]CAK1689353.1 hypothetical protein AOBTE_LOCUS37182 [Acanthoscelides obtectus]
MKWSRYKDQKTSFILNQRAELLGYYAKLKRDIIQKSGTETIIWKRHDNGTLTKVQLRNQREAEIVGSYPWRVAHGLTPPRQSFASINMHGTLHLDSMTILIPYIGLKIVNSISAALEDQICFNLYRFLRDSPAESVLSFCSMIPGTRWPQLNNVWMQFITTFVTKKYDFSSQEFRYAEDQQNSPASPTYDSDADPEFVPDTESESEEEPKRNIPKQKQEMENEPPLICAGEGESAEPSRHAASKKYKRQTDMCYFCETDVQNFVRHLRRNHLCETKVQEIFSHQKNSVERRKLLAILKKKRQFHKKFRRVRQTCEEGSFTKCIFSSVRKLSWILQIKVFIQTQKKVLGRSVSKKCSI